LETVGGIEDIRRAVRGADLQLGEAAVGRRRRVRADKRLGGAVQVERRVDRDRIGDAGALEERRVGTRLEPLLAGRITSQRQIDRSLLDRLDNGSPIRSSRAAKPFWRKRSTSSISSSAYAGSSAGTSRLHPTRPPGLVARAVKPVA